MVPFENDKIYVLLLDHEYIPTITKFEHSAIFSLKDSYEAGSPNTSALWNSDGEFFEWFVGNDAVSNRTGRWILTILTLKELVNISSLSETGIDASNVVETITGVETMAAETTGVANMEQAEATTAVATMAAATTGVENMDQAVATTVVGVVNMSSLGKYKTAIPSAGYLLLDFC